jgi:hypothetical protein
MLASQLASDNCHFLHYLSTSSTMRQVFYRSTRFSCKGLPGFAPARLKIGIGQLLI